MPVILTRKGPSVYDAETGQNVATETAQTGTGLELDYEAHEARDPSILATDRKVLLSTEGIQAPKKGDEVEIGGSTYRIETVKQFAPGGVPLYFEVQARA